MLTPAMDTDFNDAASPESLNGEALPDPATLAHSAIIKQVGLGMTLASVFIYYKVIF